MKKKRLLAFLCVGILTFGLAGCKEKGESGEKKEIEVVTNRSFEGLWIWQQIRSWDLRRSLISQ